MQVERIDDIPIICNELKSLQIANLINSHFPVHGNRQGTSLGTLCCGFLTYIISESDHRLSRVEDWYTHLEYVLKYGLDDTDLSRLDFTDDRLGSMLDYMSDDTCYESFEKALNQDIISVYSLVGEDIGRKTIHLDATIAQSFRDPSGLFSIGYAKHRRKDLPQIKAMLGTLGSFGMPLCVDIVNGASSDDVLYLPLIERIDSTLDTKGLLFVGDCKLGSLGNRSTIAKKHHYYLTPLSKVQMPFNEIKHLVNEFQKEKTLNDSTDYIYMGDKGEIKAFEHSLMRGYEQHIWQERLIIAYSPTYAQSQISHFDKQIVQNRQAIEALIVTKQGKTPIKNEQELQQKIKDILNKSKTEAFFDVHIETTITQTVVRKYKDKPEQIRQKCTFEISINLNNEAMEAHKSILGWRVYATNAPKSALDTQKVIEAYKDEYKVEYRFNQLHNKTAALMPIYLQKDERIKALIRLLMLAIKVISIIQFKAREALKETKAQVNELFPGNPGRKTDQPTAEMILRAFLNISLVVIPLKDNLVHVEVSKLSKSQLFLLKLLGIKASIYDDLTLFLKSNFKISET
jgi:transposase